MVCSSAMVSGARAPPCFNRARARPSRSVSSRLVARATTTSLPIAGESGTCSLQGTSRARNEDRFSVQIADEVPSDSTPFAYAGVYDGHGGFATSQWLEGNLLDFISTKWNASNTPEGIKEAFLSADRTLLKPSGFMGVGERGIGGSKCGSTCAAALVYKSKEGTLKLLSANVGDARVLLVRKDNSVVQLTEDHVPDSEKERKRIESMNPNKKLPLVRYVGGTWRVGGILALSRAFGDAYMKGSLQFEGIDSGSDYSSGFGVVAEPYTQLIDLDPGKDTWLIICSDGMFANEERGGGSGLDNGEVARMSNSASNAQQLAKDMCEAAQNAGSTDDVTVVALRINP